MKVLILGPVLNDKLSGGVATVSESLTNGLNELGCNANMVSLTKSSKLNNIVVKAHKYNTFHIIGNIGKIAKVIKRESPDIVVSSLQYNIGIKRYKKASPKSKFVSVLHGMACPTNGRLHSFFVNLVARYSAKHFDKTVTVSYLSQAINSKIYNIKADAVIPNGLADIDEFALKENETNKPRQYDFLYVGRLYRDKNVELLCDAFLKLIQRYPDLKLAIAGAGELQPFFEGNGKFVHNNIEYLGGIPHDQVSKIYKDAKFFVSLNSLEPLGMTYLEAALGGCNIVSPYTSGHLQLFVNDPICHLVDISSASTLCDDLERAYSNYIAPNSINIRRYSESFSSRMMAQKYLDLFEN